MIKSWIRSKLLFLHNTVFACFGLLRHEPTPKSEAHVTSTSGG